MRKNILAKKNTYLILVIIFLLMLVLNALTPIIADDFGYSLNLDKEHLHGIKDIINFQIVHYNYWGGRSVSHSLVQFFLLLPKFIFNIFNSLCYTILIYLIYNIAKGDQKDKPWLLLVPFFALYFFTPVFGQNTLWLTGSCNYLWTTTIILFLINQYLTIKNDNLYSKIFLFLLGMGAGWTNENTAFGLIIILGMIILFDFKKTKKIQVWQISGLIGSIIGFIIMIIAPGNYIRSNGYTENISLISKLFQRSINCTTQAFKYLLPFIICLTILIVIYKYRKKKLDKKVYIFTIGTVFTIYPMVLSPTFPRRAWFSSLIFLLIPIIALIFDLEIKKEKLSYFKIAMLAISLLFIIDYSILLLDVNALNKTWRYRKEYIEKNKNSEKIIVPKYQPTNRKNPLYGQLDITDNPNEWPNTDIEKYFKIKSIVTKP